MCCAQVGRDNKLYKMQGMYVETVLTNYTHFILPYFPVDNARVIYRSEVQN
jgi:hypothetical protein